MNPEGADRAELQARLDQLEQLIADYQADGIIHEKSITNLALALATARRIGAAIGILMATEKIDEDEAFDRLRAASQHANRKLRDVADAVVWSGALSTNPEPSDQ